MLSAKFYQFGSPTEVLKLEEQPRPTPAATEVLIKLRARPINPSDLLMVQGLYGLLPPLPATPGFEGVGIIEELGSDLPGLTIGQRVIPISSKDGSWQEYIVHPANRLIPVPDSVSDTAAAQFVVNPCTAYLMMFDELALKQGDWLLQTAAGSTLGRMVLQLARLRGIKTINVVRRKEQATELLALGADEVIATEQESIYERVMAITNGAGVGAAIDAVGGVVGGAVARSLANRGKLLIYGLLSGQPIPLDAGSLVFRSATIRGFWLADWFAHAPVEKFHTLVTDLMTLLATGELIPPVEAEYPLTELIKAVAHAEKIGRQGKVLLT